MKRKNPMDDLLFASGGKGPEAMAGPYETEAMVYVGDVYSLVASAAPTADPRATGAEGDTSEDPDGLWPLIR